MNIFVQDELILNLFLYILETKKKTSETKIFRDFPKKFY